MVALLEFPPSPVVDCVSKEGLIPNEVGNMEGEAAGVGLVGKELWGTAVEVVVLIGGITENSGLVIPTRTVDLVEDAVVICSVEGCVSGLRVVDILEYSTVVSPVKTWVVVLGPGGGGGCWITTGETGEPGILEPTQATLSCVVL